MLNHQYMISEFVNLILIYHVILRFIFIISNLYVTCNKVISDHS